MIASAGYRLLVILRLGTHSDVGVIGWKEAHQLYKEFAGGK